VSISRCDPDTPLPPSNENFVLSIHFNLDLSRCPLKLVTRWKFYPAPPGSAELVQEIYIFNKSAMAKRYFGFFLVFWEQQNILCVFLAS
jgi:hypothetical protein